MPRLAGWEETLHGLDDTVPGSLAADVPMKNLRGPGYLPRPVRAHLKRHTLRSDLHVSAEESAGSSDTAPAALSRGDQIEEDIEMGRYECGICCDEDINRKESIWYCQTCWAVYHFGCITRVALAARTDTVLADELHLIWRCPSCRSEYAGSPWELCWCRRNPHGNPGTMRHSANSCGTECQKPLFCGHSCRKTCHAGPCEECFEKCALGRATSKSLAREAGPTMESFLKNQSRDPAISQRPNPRRAAPPSRATNPTSNDNSRGEQGEKISYTLPFISVIFSTIMIYWVYVLTKIITEPFNYKKTAENNDAVRALWFFAAAFGFACMIVNIASLRYWGKVMERIADQYSRRSTFNAIRSILALYPFYIVGSLILFCLLPFWTFGPFISPIVAPIAARTYDFRNVCRGFDTNIILDIGDELRVYPIIKDLGPQGHQKAFNNSASKVDPYTMAVADTTQRSASMELNFYDPSYSEVFGIPDPLRNFSRTRTSIYGQLESNFKYAYVHLKGMEERQPKDFWAQFSDTSTDPEILKILFGSTWEKDGGLVLAEEQGFYRTIYDFQNRTWATKIDQKDHEQGDFEFDRHLTFPTLGLQVPNYADFAHSCKYEPYLKMHRGDGSLSQLERQGKEKYRYDGGDVVLRTASYGHTQGKLEMCARRRDVLDENGNVVLEGLGDKLPVVAGFVMSHRYQAWSRRERKGCRGAFNTN